MHTIFHNILCGLKENCTWNCFHQDALDFLLDFIWIKMHSSFSEYFPFSFVNYKNNNIGFDEI